VKVLEPLLREIEDYNETLDEDEFVASSLELIKTVSNADKNYLLSYKPHSFDKYDKFSHHPEINPVSKAILAEDELYKVPVEHRLLAHGKHRDHKLQKLKDQAQAQELSECTFEPEISHNSSLFASQRK